MNACISVVCYKSKTLSNGENPLMLQVSKGGKRKYQSLGISILPRYWDFTRNKPKPNCPNREYIQKIILDKQRELQQRMLEFNTEQKEYTTTTLLNNENTKFELKTVSEFYHELIEKYMHEGKCGNRLITSSIIFSSPSESGIRCISKRSAPSSRIILTVPVCLNPRQ